MLDFSSWPLQWSSSLIRFVMTTLCLLLALSCGDNEASDPVEAPPATDGGGDVTVTVTDDGDNDVDGDDDVPAIAACSGEGCLGSACLEDTECKEGPCVWHQGGKRCAGPCGAGCPEGWHCDDGNAVCVSDAPTLCRPCVGDEQCTPAMGPGAVCLTYPQGAGRFCGAACATDKPCPAAYHCHDGQCRSDTLTCGCSTASIALGDTTVCEATSPAGTCVGERTCTAPVLTPCDAPAPTADLCDGVDNDCDGTTDTVPCDDANPCTANSCQADGCTYTPDDQASCDDKDACTSGDHCAAGDCVGEGLLCDDGDPCTSDTCVEGSGCVSIDNGLCACAVDSDCPAPEDRCLGLVKCVLTEEKPFLHCWQDPSTEVICTVPPGPDAPCLSAECVPLTGKCIYPPVAEGGPCTPDSLCLGVGTCTAGVCIAGAPVVCDDANPCTADSCVEGSGCVFAPAGGDCEDGDLCTGPDQCTDGVCTSGPVLDCEDDSPCTLELGCEPAVGCIVVAQPGLCDDDNPCTTKDACDAGSCLGGPPLTCDDDKECTADTCTPSKGCTYIPTSDPEACCDDGVAPDGSCLPPLIANAGPDQLIAPGETASLLGSASGGSGSYSLSWIGPTGPIPGAALDVSPVKSTSWMLVVEDSVGNAAIDVVTVQVKGVPLDLCAWSLVQLDPEGQTQPPASWEPNPECDKVVQTVNAKPSILLSDIDMQSGTLTGAFSVGTEEDDDLIGFVFGYQSESDFYLFDWKQKTQTFCGVDALQGITLKHISSGGAPLECADFFASAGTPNTSIVAGPIPGGWQENLPQPYQWTLTIAGDAVTITIHLGDELVHTLEATLPGFAGGKVGFYNNSQDSVTYDLFTFLDP